MRKKKSEGDVKVPQIKTDVIAKKNFDGMLNGKKFKLKAGEIIYCNEYQLQWLQKQGVC